MKNTISFKISTLLVLVLLNNNSFSQRGTLLITAITEHGIVVAADSRGCFMDSVNGLDTPIAYYDSACKIFWLKNYIISIGGSSGIGETYFSEIISDFNQRYRQEESLENMLHSFLTYLDKQYPVQQFPERSSNVFILAGYVNEKPQIIVANKTGVQKFNTPTVISDSLANKYFTLNNANQQLSIVDLIEKTIYEYAKGEHKTHLVGGPISFWLIKPGNQGTWLKNDFSSHTYKNATALFEAIGAGKVKLHYLVADGKERLLKIAAKN